ncbi:carbamoyltransferase C-terminal domain-containing protein [Nocardioides currus]|uniref:Proline dehydrogenase n=1 Tax=Nocardioides currus TaxID=2133958 RepID=A0A2R7YWE3_9ACTN|nr:carbamoyltransferase C-terminal domain-containing protein [Nocardioides currus]PUA80209.1 proline dehydrogenase [Nocardioides currus]
MEIVSYNPGHDGAFVQLRDGHLISSVEAEKDSNWRYSPLGSREIVSGFGRLNGPPDVLAVGGWWPRESRPTGSAAEHVGYRGLDASVVLQEPRRLFGKDVHYFSSSHERSHLMSAYGMSSIPQGQPCYALVWEGAIGAFYEIDADLNITLIRNVMNQPGNRYASVYGLADPSFPKDAPFSRFSDAGKLMALASYSIRKTPTIEEQQVIDFLLGSLDVRLDLYQQLESSVHYNVGVDDEEFRNFAGIVSDRIFDTFHRFAESNLRQGWPLLIAGGCGLNCDWNSKWRDSGLFSDIFVPPVANDSGSAIGTAIDAQWHATGNAKIEWDVYSGLPFEQSATADLSGYDVTDIAVADVAAMLDFGLILGWVNGRYEIGPRALGNRSILAAPFGESTRVRLNDIKQREQFRPIAPVCLEVDAAQLFGCTNTSPHMLYTYRVATPALAAVTHVNGSARLQTVSMSTNPELHELLVQFKRRTGFGVLCNTSLNYSGKGFINNLRDLAEYAKAHKLDGFVVDRRAYLRQDSEQYTAFRGRNQEVSVER